VPGELEEVLTVGSLPAPLRCFLEVLNLKDFKSFEPEVLILVDFKSLFPEVLILVKLKAWQINEMRGIGKFSEVLIPEELSGVKCTNGWIWAGFFERESRPREEELFCGRACRAAEIPRRIRGADVRLQFTPTYSMSVNGCQYYL
jgi:hypothetical protein